jgi:hypothetical protein
VISDNTQIGQMLGPRLSDFFEGYVLVGFLAGTDDPIIMYSPSDRRTALALNQLLESAKRPLKDASP